MPESAAVPASSIHVMYGTSSRVIEEVRRLTPPAVPIVWLVGSPAPSAWQAMRQLMAQVVGEIDSDAFSEIVARHRPVIAILYPEHPVPLAAVELERSRALRADGGSLYIHSAASWQPLIAAAAELVADVVAAADAVVAVPELARLDLQTGHVLLEAFRAHGARLVGLHVGHDPGLAYEPQLVWGVSVSWSIEQIRSGLCDYQLAPACRVLWLSGAGAPSTLPRPPVNAWSGAAPDAIALAALAATTPPAPSDLDACVAAMRWAIEAYAFASAFRIGALLEPHRQRLGRAAQADHAAALAVAATCAHFVDLPTPGFDEPLYAMYERAIALCADPIATAALAVRLAFAAVDRGAQEVDRYLDAAGARVDGLHDELWTAYYGAWLAIARALHQLHLADWPAADLHAQHACTAFDRVAALAPAVLSSPRAAMLRREASCGRFMILAHAAIHGARAGSPLATQWLAQAEHERPGVPAVLLFEVFHWVLLDQRDDERDDRSLVYERCRAGIGDAERCWDAKTWYLYLSVAADCADRLGRPSDAAAHLRRLLSCSSFGNIGAGQVGDVRPLALRALLRAGDYTDVVSVAELWLTDQTASHAEVHAMIAWALAASGDGPGALRALDLAIDDAVAQGDQPVMLQVAMIAVRVMSALQDATEAARALDNAWGLAEDAPGQLSEAVSPQDGLRLCVLQVQLVGATPELLARALSLLPACLSDAESWWDATELLEQLVAWCQRGEALPAEARVGFAAVRRLASNRAEWQACLDILEPFVAGPIVAR